LAYGEVKRRVIFQRAPQRDAVFIKPRNVIIQWAAPSVSVRKEFKNLGVVSANPANYVARYGSSLIASSALPAIATSIAAPAGLVLAANSRSSGIAQLEGDVAALALIDLASNGLGQYSGILASRGITAASAAAQYGITNVSVAVQGVAASSAVQYGLGSSVSYAAAAPAVAIETLAYGGDAEASYAASSSSFSSGAALDLGSSYALGASSGLSAGASYGLGASSFGTETLTF